MGESMSRSLQKVIYSAALVMLLGSVPLMMPEYYVGLSAKALVLAILAMSANLLIGYLGLASLGQASFAGVASYAVGIGSLKFGLGPVASMGLAVAATLAIAALFGILAVRTRDIFFLVIMLAFSQVLYAFAYSLKSITGGDDGLPGVLRPWTAVESTTGFYLLCAGVFLAALFLFDILVNSHFGLALKGVRDSESRMRVLGYNVWTYRYLGFICSALIGAVAGILLAYLDGCPNPKDFGVIRSSTALLMVILGGPGTLLGPLVGSTAIVFLEDYASGITDRWLMILGFVYVAVVLLFPEGILGVRLKTLLSAKNSFFRGKSGKTPTAEPAAQSPTGR